MKVELERRAFDDTQAALELERLTQGSVDLEALRTVRLSSYLSIGNLWPLQRKILHSALHI